MDALLGMLAPDVVLHADGGGKTQAIGKPLAGRQPVMRMLVSLLRRGRALGASLRLAWVNGQPGAVLYDAEGRVVSVIELDTGPNGTWSRRCTPWSIPTSSPTSDRCPMWRDCRKGGPRPEGRQPTAVRDTRPVRMPSGCVMSG